MLAMRVHLRDRLALHLAFSCSNRLAGRMKILLISETLLPGGAETFVLRLANALVGEHEVALAILHGEMVKAELRAKLDPRIKVHLLKVPAKRALFKVDSLLEKYKANTGEPKGLEVPDLGPNSWVYGSSAHIVSSRIAGKIGAPRSNKMGRGSQFREDMENIYKTLNITTGE